MSRATTILYKGEHINVSDILFTEEKDWGHCGEWLIDEMAQKYKEQDCHFIMEDGVMCEAEIVEFPSGSFGVLVGEDL